MFILIMYKYFLGSKLPNFFIFNILYRNVLFNIFYYFKVNYIMDVNV